MIDLHCHVLPGIDDGAREISESINLARAAYESGITHIVCTPHIHSGYFDNDMDIIRSTHELFRAALHRESIPLKSHFAAEVRIDPSIVFLVNSNRLPYLGEYNGSKVLLLELPHSHIPAGTEQLIQWLKARNIIPMIAHPERNRDILANYNKANWLRGKGVFFQLTAGSITGTFGERVKCCVNRLLNDGFAEVVATDAHNMYKRPPELAGAYKLLSRDFGKASADDLCINNPLEIASCFFND